MAKTIGGGMAAWLDASLRFFVVMFFYLPQGLDDVAGAVMP